MLLSKLHVCELYLEIKVNQKILDGASEVFTVKEHVPTNKTTAF